MEFIFWIINTLIYITIININTINSKKENYNDIIIDDDYFECVYETKKYQLMPNKDNNKIYLNIKTDNYSNVNLDSFKINENKTQLVIKKNESHYLNIYGRKDYPICFNILYADNNITEYKKDIEYKIKIRGSTYEFKLIELIKGKRLIIILESEDKKTQFYPYFEGAEELNYPYGNYKMKIEINPNQETVKMKLDVLYTDNINEFTFSFHDDRVGQNKALFITAIVFGSICFALTFIMLISPESTNCNLIDCDDTKEKLLSLYFCKKYNFLEDKKRNLRSI